MLSVTVVIVNYNSGELLYKCLSSLVEQSFSPRHIVVIDNASKDGSLARVETFPGVKLHKLDQNIGFASANNLALSECDSEFIALLNPDAFPESNWLERLIDSAQKNPAYSMFASQQLMDVDCRYLDGEGDAYHISGLVWREGYGQRLRSDARAMREVFSPCAAAALYRREAFLSVGGFDEDFFCYVEDVDLAFRLRLMGYRCLLVPSAIVHHFGSATTGGQHSDFSIYHGHRNLIWTYVKNMPGWLFWACLPLHLAMNVVAIVLFALRGQGKVILRAKRDALLGLPKIWRKRRAVQQRRVASTWEIWRILDKSIIPGTHFRQAKFKFRWLMR